MADIHLGPGVARLVIAGLKPKKVNGIFVFGVIPHAVAVGYMREKTLCFATNVEKTIRFNESNKDQLEVAYEEIREYLNDMDPDFLPPEKGPYDKVRQFLSLYREKLPTREISDVFKTELWKEVQAILTPVYHLGYTFNIANPVVHLERLTKHVMMTREATMNFLEIPLTDNQAYSLSLLLDRLYRNMEYRAPKPVDTAFLASLDSPSFKVTQGSIQSIQHSFIVLEFTNAILIPQGVPRNQVKPVSMKCKLLDFLTKNCVMRTLPQVLQPSSSVTIVTPQQQVVPGSITAIGGQSRRDAFEYYVEQLVPIYQSATEVKKKARVYDRFVTLRGESFKLSRYITVEQNVSGTSEESYYVLRKNRMKGEGKLYIEVSFHSRRPQELYLDIYYNLLTADAMRGAATEMLCYILNTIMHEKPWEEHGVQDVPTDFSLKAFGGGPGSLSEEPTPEGIRRLVRLYKRLGFIRSELEIAMLPNATLRISLRKGKHTFSFEMEEGDVDSDDESDDESDKAIEVMDVVMVPNVAPEVVSQFVSLAEDN